MVEKDFIDNLPSWEQVEEEQEDYQYFKEQQQEEEKKIIKRINKNGFIEGFNIAH